MSIGRAELVRRVADKSAKSHKETGELIKAVLDTIQEVLVEGEDISLVGFGKFSVKETAPSVRVNPQTRAKINVPARKRVKFSPGKELAESVAASKAAPAAPAKAEKAAAAPAKAAPKASKK